MRVTADAGRAVYESHRRWPGRAATSIEIERGRPLFASALETFLTARFRLYSRLYGRLAFADVEHEPWPLEEARAVRCEQTLTRADGLPDPAGEPLAHFSTGVTTRLGPPEWHRAASP